MRFKQIIEELVGRLIISIISSSFDLTQFQQPLRVRVAARGASVPKGPQVFQEDSSAPLRPRQAHGFLLSDAGEADLNGSKAHGATLAKGTGLASCAVVVSGRPVVGVGAGVSAVVACQEAFAVGFDPVHPSVVGANDVRGSRPRLPMKDDADLGDVKRASRVDQDAEFRIGAGLPVQAGET